MLKNYDIHWETDYCEDYADLDGIMTVEAENEDDALNQFYAHKPDFKAIPMRVEESTYTEAEIAALEFKVRYGHLMV